ncbi:class Ib ribonucleoside-diphosphate reductase assembly flavoprotein NrdI [Staphylococcus chromogenes]|uniref:class Ib ribonucleoside-diphosphate reductase assembly flavoprotein NrdI n=1 Tax=Staphylococcus chromogenes TaxID=46126 RepID=UPI00288637F3|nr:class Ib ribonucleoside-diphosphate reductase assembly flavoprotein NrdI [Staphylococcus chromogenes]MDT0700326.1 class Ib ribonucleoside-diphosphate reductase assembly flavoprotein NrdI [Staphylococcus chromogenes]
MSKIKYNEYLCICYYTFSMKTERFINKLNDVEKVKINRDSLINKPYILVTPTYNIGEIPEEVDIFLNNNHANMIAVMSSGNRNWGENFAIAGEKIADRYKVDLIGKFEMYGTQNDVDKLINYINNVSK